MTAPSRQACIGTDPAGSGRLEAGSAAAVAYEEITMSATLKLTHKAIGGGSPSWQSPGGGGR